ncbi:hypothetical protein A2Z22_01715 [Candidatus Woesebacteria bacterium RBG_16_34_12]|uniref:Uncharacterized protein n=1 Tax=Candidatus Woesebacteria bacterium RBG_16_34_12 TaxID=1802480 RepID=A0A1F7XAA0_9BACT|nr:MAG: hypothetical protein A2Z22_01715 [Candidatus Woesebacteria bacterium RBG_16_34_12]
MENKRNFLSNFLYPYIIEALLVFLILNTVLIIEFYFRNLISYEVIKVIAERSLFLSVTYILFFRLIKSGYFLLFRFFSSLLPKSQTSSLSLIEYLTDIFITLVVILTTAPLRPILQKVYFEEGKPIFDQAMVRFDAEASIIILSIIGVPLILLNLKKHQGIVKIFNIIAIILVTIIVGYINNQPNYNARIYESRADWITRNWEKQNVDAQKALKDAKTDQEKASAYYWLGVSESRQGNYQKGIEYQHKAIELDPTYGAPYSSLSLSNLALGNLEEAKVYAEKCIGLSPDYAWCYYALSGYYAYTNEMQEAYDNLIKAIDLDPKATDFQKTLEEFKKANPQFTK